MPPAPLTLGVDGCKAGWIAATAPDLSTPPRFVLFERFSDLAAEVVTAAEGLALVDIPIGLTDGRRACDAAARKLLGPRRACSVFTPPSRAALAGTTPAELRRLNLAATGRSLSAQSLGLLRKIAEVDAVVTPALQRHVREAHPECAFAVLDPGRTGLAERKKSAEGRRRRLALLPPAFARVAEAAPFPAGRAASDDYVDALVLLVAALRHRAGAGGRLTGPEEQRDARGLVMEILY
jgi:predicted RNase H-like nuclease